MNKFKMILIAGLVAFVGAAAADHKSDHSVKARTMPTGKIYKEGDDVPVSKAPVVAEPTGPKDGASVYTAKCAMCHSAGIAGAPKTGEAGAWTDRIAQGEAMLYDHAINGFTGSGGVMPAKGGCADCSDDDIKAAVDHMLSLL